MRQSRSGSGAAVGRGVVQERFSAFKVFVDRAREDRDPSRLFFLGSLSLAEMPQCVPLDMIDLLHRTHTFWPVLDVVLTLRIKTTVRTAWGGRDGERGQRKWEKGDSLKITTWELYVFLLLTPDFQNKVS